MTNNKREWKVVTDPEEIAKIDEATHRVLNDEQPSGPPAAGSAGIPWGGSDAHLYWGEHGP